MRSSTFAGSSGTSGATISSPAALRSMSASSSSRYSSWYFSGSNVVDSELTSWRAISISRSVGSRRGLGDRALTIGREHLVGVAHRLEHEHAVDGADRDERLLRAHHEPPDRDLALLLHHVGEQAVGLRRFLVGHEEVGVLEVDGVDVDEVDEVLDLDLAARLRRQRRELVGLDDHVAARLELVALHDLVEGHLFAGLLRHALLAHPGARLRLQLVEADVERLRGRHQPHGHGDEAEAHGSGPDRLGHCSTPSCPPCLRCSAAPALSPPPAGSQYLRRSWRLGERLRDRATASVTHVEIDGRRLRLTNLDKVLYPATGFTKGQVVDYYARIGPVMLPHLARRPATMVRLPDGIDGERFFEKRCPGHRPEWLATVPLDADSATQACCIEELAVARVDGEPRGAGAPHPPGDGRRSVEADRDGVRPRPGRARRRHRLRACRARAARHARPARAARRRRRRRARRDSTCRCRCARRPTPSTTKAFALALGQLLEKGDPQHVTVNMAKEQRPNRVFVDWSQNDRHKTTVCVYSLRATPTPGVSTPLTWDEVAAIADGDESLARHSPPTCSRASTSTATSTPTASPATRSSPTWAEPRSPSDHVQRGSRCSHGPGRTRLAPRSGWFTWRSEIERGVAWPSCHLGTVTFLFTDLEVSTRLWEQHHEAMVDARARYFEIVDGAVARSGGVVFSHAGDGVHGCVQLRAECAAGWRRCVS